MKLPSILKTPRYQRFHIEPRYYDPLKEEIKQRQKRIRRNLEADGSAKDDDASFSSSTLQGSFTRRRSVRGGSASMTQLIIMLLLSALIFGYIFLGEVAVYGVVAISSVLLYFKVKRRE